MNHEPLSARDRTTARRNYVVFCGVATILIAALVVIAVVFANG